MTDEIALRIDVNDVGLRLRLDALPKRLEQRVARTIRGLVDETLPMVLAAEPVRTGRLRSLTHSYVDVREGFVRGRVRVVNDGSHNTAAAEGALEYGAPGPRGFFIVKSHSAKRTIVFGRRIKQPHTIGISAYFRHQNLRARRFIRGPAALMLAKARIALEHEIQQEIATP